MVVNFMQEATHGQYVHLGWKKLTTGCLKITFIITESIKIESVVIPGFKKVECMVSVQVDGDSLYSEHQMKKQV